MRRPWPQGLPNCVLCNVEHDTVAYGGRALCIYCYSQARRRDELSQYEFVGRATGRDNLARRVANQMGSRWSADQMGVPLATFQEWCNRRGSVTFTASVKMALLRLHRIATEPTEIERSKMFDYDKDNSTAWMVLLCPKGN